MSCFCAVADIVRCWSTSQATSSVSSARKLVGAAEAPRVGAAQRRMIAAAALGDVVKESGDVEHFPRAKSAISREQSGYSCACCASVNRRRLRITIRMCSSTV
jgi:hypothetical protein